MTRPTLEDIKAVLTEYTDEEARDRQAEWLYENYHRELERLRPIIFGDLTRRLIEYYKVNR